MTFSTTGADFDNVVSVYSGGFGHGNIINHAYSYSKSASVTFHADAGVTYSISVGGDNGQTGNFIFYGGLSPANDDFVNVQAIYGTAGQVQGVNLPTTSELGEPNHAGEIGGKSIWCCWAAKTIADGADGKTRVLWVNTDGTLSLGNLDNATGTYDYHNFGPHNGWTATGLSAAQ